MSKTMVLLKQLFRFSGKNVSDLYYQSIADFGFGPEAMKRIKVCAICGQQEDSNAWICSNCGARLPAQTLYDFYCEGHRQCHGCGAVLSHDAVFCPICGRETDRQETDSK